MEEEHGAQGYLYEPDRSAYQGYLSEEDLGSSDSEGENPILLSTEGRSKMLASVWCKCGKCTVQKTDIECYCCKEHELLSDRMEGLTCFTLKDRLEEYIVHKPALEMAFIDAMIKNFVRGPAPEGELSNKQVYYSEHLIQIGMQYIQCKFGVNKY